MESQGSRLGGVSSGLLRSFRPPGTVRLQPLAVGTAMLPSGTVEVVGGIRSAPEHARPSQPCIPLFVKVVAGFALTMSRARRIHRSDAMRRARCAPRAHPSTESRWGLLPLVKGGHRIGLVLDCGIEEDLLLRHVQVCLEELRRDDAGVGGFRVAYVVRRAPADVERPPQTRFDSLTRAASVGTVTRMSSAFSVAFARAPRAIPFSSRPSRVVVSPSPSASG